MTYKDSVITNIQIVDLNNDNTFDIIISYYSTSDKTKFNTDVMVSVEGSDKYTKIPLENLSTQENLSGIMVSDINGDG